MTAPIRYRIQPARPEAHLFSISCELADPAPEGQVFTLPAWIPGSYMIREFARNIVSIRAESEGSTVRLEKLDKHSWRAGRVTAGATLLVSYEVYAWDLSVRTAHLDQTHAFFNGTSVFLLPEGREERECLVEILRPEGPEFRPWKLATAMEEARGHVGAARRHDFGLYRAACYDELIDHPVEMGDFTLATFEAGGIAHEIVLSGRHDCDLERLCADLGRICQWHIELFGAPPPMQRYLFLTMVVGDGYGGLEHRASTALLTSRSDLPYRGMKGSSDGYRRFLGLCSHEYFHSWNVKRIKPAAFVPYDLSCENHTRLLWAFEGITSYYDDLALVRSGTVSADEYLTQLGKTIGNVLRGSGRFRQSVAESSFDAWTKYYRQDENAPNAIVSYYTKGALIALCLDLQMRLASDGRQSLDDLMRVLWERHGKTGEGVAEDGIFELLAELAGTRLAGWLRKTVNGTEDLPLARLLKAVGVGYRLERADAAARLGVKLASGEKLKLASVLDDGAAQQAGLSAGDVIIAMDGLKVSSTSFEARLERLAPGDSIRIHAFRRDELMTFELVADEAPLTEARLSLRPRDGSDAMRLRRGWIGV